MTTKIKDLIEWLSQYPEDMKIYKAIKSPPCEMGYPDTFTIEKDITKHPDDYIMVW